MDQLMNALKSVMEQIAFSSGTEEEVKHIFADMTSSGCVMMRDQSEFKHLDDALDSYNSLPHLYKNSRIEETDVHSHRIMTYLVCDEEMEDELDNLYDETGGTFSENIEFLFTKCDEIQSIAFMRAYIYTLYRLTNDAFISHPYKSLRNDEDTKSLFIRCINKLSVKLSSRIINSIIGGGYHMCDSFGYNDFWNNAYTNPSYNEPFILDESVCILADIMDAEINVRSSYISGDTLCTKNMIVNDTMFKQVSHVQNNPTRIRSNGNGEFSGRFYSFGGVHK